MPLICHRVKQNKCVVHRSTLAWANFWRWLKPGSGYGLARHWMERCLGWYSYYSWPPWRHVGQSLNGWNKKISRSTPVTDASSLLCSVLLPLFWADTVLEARLVYWQQVKCSDVWLRVEHLFKLAATETIPKPFIMYLKLIKLHVSHMIYLLIQSLNVMHNGLDNVVLLLIDITMTLHGCNGYCACKISDIWLYITSRVRTS